MASKIFHFKKFSYVHGNFKAEISFDRFSKQFQEAQWWLGETVLQDCRAYMPLDTGGMRQRSTEEEGEHLVDASKVEADGRMVVFPGPYARYQYGGMVMVDPDTGSPWARPGVTKVLTSRPLTYSQPMATDHWFDAAKAAHGQYWISEVKKRAGGGKK